MYILFVVTVPISIVCNRFHLYLCPRLLLFFAPASGSDQEVSRVESASFKTSPVSDGDGDGDGNEVPTQSGAASEDSSPAASVLLEGAQVCRPWRTPCAPI